MNMDANKLAASDPAPDLVRCLVLVEQIVHLKKSISMAVMNGDGEVFQEYKSALEQCEREIDWESVLASLKALDSLSQMPPTLTTGQEVEQLMALDSRPVRVSCEFMAMLFEQAKPSRDLRGLPAGRYILRKKYDLEDSFDAEIEGADGESCFSVPIHEATSALLRDAREKQKS